MRNRFRFVLMLVCSGVLATTAGHASDDGASDATTAVLDKYAVRLADTPIRKHPGWRKPQQVVIYLPQAANLRPDYKEWFQAAAGDAKITFAADRASLREAAGKADVVFGSCDAVDAEATQLRWMQRYGVGVERCLANPGIAREGVLLTNTRGLSGPFIAEHAIGMMMMLSHRLNQYYDNQQAQRWDRSAEFTREIRPVAGAHMLVVGLGGIGTKVAEKAAALGMQVKAIRNSRREGPDFVQYVGLSHELPTLAAEADVVVNTLPLTDKTTGIYDKAFFQTMKNTAYFITVGRGKSVVTDHLVAALNNGDIAGAALDVTDPEPLPESHPLWHTPNVLITPHTSGRSGYGSADTVVFVRENLRRYTAGEPLYNVVDRALGY